MTEERPDGTTDRVDDASETAGVDPTEYYDVLAPLPEELPWTELDALSELVAGYYDQGVELTYHEYVLRNLSSPAVASAWGVASPHDGESRFVAVLNLAGFRDVADLQAYLDELVAVAPESRAEWIAHRRSNLLGSRSC